MNIGDWINKNQEKQLDTLLASFREVEAPRKKTEKMTKSAKKSWTKFEYKYACRLFRRGYSFKTLQESEEHHLSILKAADYSYQAKGHFVTGWSSGIRFDKFYNRVQSCKYSTWSIPF